MRAVLEGVAYMLRRNVEFLDGTGASAGEITLARGRGSKSLWNQIKADVCGRPVANPLANEDDREPLETPC